MRHVALVALFAVCACSEHRADIAAGDTAGPSSLTIEWLDSIRIDERPDAVLVEPDVALDSREGFLVADQRESRIHRFHPDGKLDWTAGGPGDGPGEFRHVTAVRRFPDGRLLAVDYGGRITVFDSIAQNILFTASTDLRRVDDVEILDAARIMVAGFRGDPASPRLHIFDFESSTIEESFFDALAGTTNLDAAMTAGWVKLSVRADTVAAIFSVKDSVFLFTREGEPIRTLHIATPHFRPVPPRASAGQREVNLLEIADWISTFDLLSDVMWLDDGSLLVAYQSIAATPSLSERSWHLVAIERDGRGIRELRDTPRPLTRGRAAGTVLFVSPGSLTPDRWSVGRLEWGGLREIQYGDTVSVLIAGRDSSVEGYVGRRNDCLMVVVPAGAGRFEVLDFDSIVSVAKVTETGRVPLTLPQTTCAAW